MVTLDPEDQTFWVSHLTLTAQDNASIWWGNVARDNLFFVDKNAAGPEIGTRELPCHTVRAAHTASSRAPARSYSISKFTIAGGGGLNSTGGVHAVSGTIGQPDASGPLSGGTYTLVGGFWALPTVVQAPGAPLLGVEQLAGNSVRVYWPLPATGFVLDQATSFISPPATNAWSQVAFPYRTSATHISITAAAAVANRYDRLRKQ